MGDAQLSTFLEQTAALGRSARFSLRRILREGGAPFEPGVELYVNGVKHERPATSLEWLPGEEDWNRGHPPR